MPASKEFVATSPDDTFRIGKEIGAGLKGGELILLTGGLGAGKTVVTKGIVSALGYDPDEVTSPSFTLVNLYPTQPAVYHIDLWRLDGQMDPAAAVGLDDILADKQAVAIVEWADRLRHREFGRETIMVKIDGDGDEPRQVTIGRVTSPHGL